MNIDKLAAQKMLPHRKSNSHKGTFGTVLVIGGSRNMPGAPCIAALGALKSGAGLVKVAFPDVIYNAVTAHSAECIYLPLYTNENGKISSRYLSVLEKEISKASSIVIGCGMGVCPDTEMLVDYVIENACCTVVVDADALNCVAKNLNTLTKSKSSLILTPHPGEMARLLKSSADFINSNRQQAAASFAKKYGATLLLKGQGTVIADKNGEVRVNTTGNSGLSKGGSGDLLSGIIGALAANTNAFDAASLGAYLHGLSADLAAQNHTQYCLTQGICANYLSEAFKSLL
ncbi:MAG TPA: NAD(P)H-hydrate dehydratase [Oscillospiraceae bacterium]|nr:NAD(P)H-hydrate dehydratase [Oscillospiraceae bacterium]